MIKELETVRDGFLPLTFIERYGETPYDDGEFQGFDIHWNGKYAGFISENNADADLIVSTIKQALATLDSILKRDQAELVDHVTKALFSETFGFDSFTQEKMRSILDKQTKAALRALGLIPESEQS